MTTLRVFTKRFRGRSKYFTLNLNQAVPDNITEEIITLWLILEGSIIIVFEKRMILENEKKNGSLKR